MKTKSLCLLLSWILLLPLGLAAWIAVHSRGLLPFEMPTFGKVGGVAQGSISDTDRDLHSSFEGRTEPRWEWRIPKSFHYQSVSLQWNSPGAKGNGVMNLSTMTLESAGERTQVDAEWFRRLLRNRPLAEECVSVLDDVRTGNLPPPGQLPRTYNRDGLRRSLEHKIDGWQLPYSTIAWTGLWVGGSVGIAIRKRGSRRRIGRGD